MQTKTTTPQAPRQISLLATGEDLLALKDPADRKVAVTHRFFANLTLPMHATTETSVTRHIGWGSGERRGKLILQAAQEYGLPSGSIARLLVHKIQTQVAREKSAEILLGENLTATARALGISTETETRRKLAEQICKLLHTTWFFHVPDGADMNMYRFSIDDGFGIQNYLDENGVISLRSWRVLVRVNDRLFHALTQDRLHPFDYQALVALRGAPLEMDLYVLFATQAWTLRAPKFFPIAWFCDQLGTSWNPKNKKHRSRLQQKLKRALPNVQSVYPQLRAELTTKTFRGTQYGGIMVHPSPPHVPPRTRARIAQSS